MRDLICDGTLRELFDLPGLPECLRGAWVPEAPYGQGGLFADVSPYTEAGASGPAAPVVPPELFELSADAYYAAVLALLSELPVGGPVLRFCRKVLAAAETVCGDPGTPAARADRAATDRGDDDVRAVLEAAAKVTREIDRLRGLLRFRADEAGIYIARCAPDHFVLPTLAGHFELRFGETPWAIIDEKRGLALARLPGEEPRLIPGTAFTASLSTGRAVSGESAISGNAAAAVSGTGGEVSVSPRWEELWRVYHRSVNNENRKNPDLQRQFMPVRYWKYLTEMQGDRPV
jgi:probable DNA metabolism protein